MARKGENINKRSDGRWEARYIIGYDRDGKARYKSLYGHSYKEVKEKKRDAMRNLPDFNYVGRSKTGTVESVSRDWIMSNSHKWKESTRCRYQEKLDIYILPEFGKRKLSDISTKEIEDFIIRLQTEGLRGRRPVGASAAAMIMTVIRQLRLQALKTDCQVRYSGESISIRRHKPQTFILSESEEKKLVAKLKENMDETAVGILTSLFTGIRIGELCALKCDNIDLYSGIIHVRETMQRLPDLENVGRTVIRINAPKSDCSIRDIPLNSMLVEMLRPFVKPGAFLLTGDCEKFIEPRTMEYRFNSILKKCGLNKMGYHSTRRTFASRCIERGMDPKTLSEIMGHASVSTTLDFYVRVNLKRKAEGLNLLSDLFSV